MTKQKFFYKRTKGHCRKIVVVVIDIISCKPKKIGSVSKRDGPSFLKNRRTVSPDIKSEPKSGTSFRSSKRGR